MRGRQRNLGRKVEWGPSEAPWRPRTSAQLWLGCPPPYPPPRLHLHPDPLVTPVLQWASPAPASLQGSPQHWPATRSPLKDRLRLVKIYTHYMWYLHGYNFLQFISTVTKISWNVIIIKCLGRCVFLLGKTGQINEELVALWTWWP